MLRGNFCKGLAVLLVLGLFAAGCAKEKPPRSYVQSNVIDKGYFQGEWWHSSKVVQVNVPFEGMTYPGDATADYSGNGFSCSRIRWVIDENYLYAFRSYELVRGSNPDATNPVTGQTVSEYIGEPVAAYRIQSHFDIRRQYNPTTGENYNVIEENTVDRKWFERQYMRVDWSQNLLVSWMVNSAELYSDAGILDKEPVPMFVDQNSQWEDYFPAAWKPTFAFADPDYDAVHGTHLADDPATPEQEGDYMPGELYYMGITQQAIFTPGMVDDPYTGEPVPWCMSVYVDAPICTSNLVTMRSNFLKISPTHEYEPLYYPDKSRFDRFGAFRAERWTYDDITGDDPLDYHLGETDFLDYYANRFNIWADTYDEDGNLIPYDQRSIKHIVYHTSKEMPPWLWRPALEFMGEWNEVLMDIVRIRKNEGQALRDYMNIRDWYQPPDPALRDINCYLAAVTETGSYEFMEDPMAVGEDGLPLRTITSWDDFLDENRLTQTYDPDYSFQAPDGRTIRPGNECLLETRINSCSRPLYALPADVQAMLMAYMDEHGILDYADMTDDDRYAAGFECEERGDMRYKLVSYLADPGPPFLGVTSIQGDPVTGEIVWGDCNIAAWDLHRYRVRATDEIDLANGDITEIDYIVGEDVAGYYEKLGYTLPPPEPIVPRWLQGHDGITNGVSLAGINENMERVMKKAELLKGAAGKQNLLNYRRQLLQGTDIERKLLDNDEAMLAAGMITKPDEGTPRPLDAIIASISPFRHSVLDVISSDLDTFQKFSRNNVEMADFFQDFSVVAFAERHKDWPRTNVIFNLEQIMMKETLIHEFGHTLNLRHNMRGTADPWNYPEPYFDIVAQYPRPLMEDFDTNGDMMLDNAESDAYHAAYMEVEKQRELNQNGATAHLGSIDGWMTSSMMDYTGQWYNRIIPKGHYVDPYDKAAIHFSYGDLVEVYDNSAGLLAHCKDPASGRIADCITPDKVAKGQIGMVMWTYYAGGENCGIDDDCPYSWGGTQRWALEEGQGVAQWCNAGTCSNFYDDMHATYTGERPAYVVREYKYCTDERRTDIGMDDSQCNIFDEGASYRDIVQNMRDTYHRKYIFNNFRRFRGDYDFYPYYSAVVGRFFLEPVKIFQDMIYRYATDPAYRTDDGPFGFYDQYMASVDLLNFWTEIMAYPNVGAYKYLPYNNVWDQYNENPAKAVGGPPKFMRVDLGTGKYHYSRYQRGQNGVYRVEHFGTIYDKMWAQELLMVRGMAFPYSPDEYFYINFYDVFPEEITAMVRGMISDEPEVWKPRILSFDEETDNPILVMPTLYRGNCLPEEMIPDDAHPEIYSCRPDPMAQYPVAEHPPLQDYGSYYLMMYALIYGLSELPVYFDTQPQDMIHFYRVGSLFDADIPKCACDPDCACDCDLTAGTCDTDCACDPDCTADCTCDTNATCQNSVEGVDYVTFTSDMFHNTYLAFQVDDVQSGYEGYALKKGGSIAFDVLMKCKDYQQHLRDWEVCMAAGTTCGFESTSALSDAYWFEFYELQNYEGMINYAIELQQMFGIASWMGY